MESVAWISGRTDLLGAVAFLCALSIALWSAERRDVPALGLVAVALLAGLFTKESVAVLPAVLAAWALTVGRDSSSRTRWLLIVAVSLATVSAWLVFRRVLLGPDFRVYAPVELLNRLPFYLRHLMAMPAVPAALVWVVSLAACVSLRPAAWRVATFWGVAWPVIHLLPGAAVDYDSTRHVLLASAGPAVLVALVVDEARRFRAARWAALIACAALAIVLASRTVADVRQWTVAGEYSRRLVVLLDRARYADDELVVLGRPAPVPPMSPPRGDGAWFWEFAMPFAAAPPFAAPRARILEPPEWYCCLEHQWLAARAPIFADLAAGRIRRVHRVKVDAATGDVRLEPVARFPAPPPVPTLAAARFWLAHVNAVPSTER